jgi:hypothetical protein
MRSRQGAATSGMAASPMPVRAAAAAVALLALAIPAFWPDYQSKIARADAYTHVHALLGLLLWLLLLIAQPLLIRAIGRAAIGIGAAFFVSSVLLTHHRASRMDAAAFERDGFGFYLPLEMAALFAAALVLALRWRRVAPLHSRFMLCTSLALIYLASPYSAVWRQFVRGFRSLPLT